MGNTTTTNNKKKKSNARKLIPAIGMLMTSAAMLTTSTYAWFTMNKEVSITGITLTASVPETLEISLGNKGADGLPKQNASTHFITVTDPVNDDTGRDWSNTVDIIDYYKTSNTNEIDFGQLVPVSSTDGANMFYTSDAIGDGHEVKDTASFSPKNTELINSGPNRYYLDIPVWFRSTAVSETAANVELSVKATIIKTGGDEDKSELYKAARASILTDNKAATAGVIMNTEAEYNSKNSENKFTAVNAEGTISKTSLKDSFYGAVDPVVQTDTDGATAETVVSVPKKTGSDTGNHGQMKKMYVRIWLEGEDKACYNPNAGQSFTISLEFKDKNATT